ncbi:MAG: VanZ family protein [Bacillaceae bacterium]
MQIYRIPFFLLVGIFGLAIYLLIDFKKNKANNLYNRAIYYSFIFYLILVLHVTIGYIFIPLQEGLTSFQVKPFNFVSDLIREYASGEWFFWNSLKLYFYNLIMLFPLGIYLRNIFKINNLYKIVYIAFLFSLTIEILQLTLSYIGLIFNRSFDIDDLILNTIGATLGYILMIRIEKINKKGFGRNS